MKLVEAFSEGKLSAPSRNEDGWCLTADFAAVVDGSTSKAAAAYAVPGAPAASAGETTGRRAMRTVVAAIKSLPAEADMPEAARCLTEALAAVNTPESLGRPELRCTCSAAVVSRRRREVWLFGDCQCRFLGTTHTNGKHVDEVLTRIRCEAVRYLLAHGHTAADLRRRDLGRAFIYDTLRAQTGFQNSHDALNPYRYTVLDGTPIDTSTVPVLALGSARRVVLASDGYPLLRDTLAETEAELQRLLRDDPLCIGENAATKCLMEGQCSFDDRTFLAVDLTDDAG